MRGRFAVVVGMALAAVGASAQTPPCEDRDLDGFLAGPGCAVQEDCNDANSKVFPGAVEVCNGWDDDCDGDLDEGCNRVCADFAQTRRVTIFSPAAEPEIAAADRSWAFIYWDQSTAADPSAVTRLDLRGETLVDDRVFTGAISKNHEIVWTGTEMVGSWTVPSFIGPDRGLYFRALGPWGRPDVEPRRLSDHDLTVSDLLWNGHESAMLKADRTLHSTILLRLGPEPGAEAEETIVDPSGTYQSSLAWNGNGYGWVSERRDEWTDTSDIFFQSLDAFGNPESPPFRLTDHRASPGTWAAAPVIVAKGPGQGYGVCWTDFRNLKFEDWCAILDGSGAKLTPPGEFQATFAEDDVGQVHDLGWNGEEFLLVWTNLDASGNPLGRIAATRISANGEVLEWRNVTSMNREAGPRVAWNGTSWGMSLVEQPLFPAGDPAAAFVEIGCNCNTDGDGDGILPCGGGDCDDGDNTVGTGKPEVCLDGKDNDCDGLIDCNDVDCHQNGNAPTAIGGFVFAADKVGFSWSADARAARYDVARGELSDLRDMENFRWTGCQHSHLAGTTGSDADEPTPGRGFYYLVRGAAKTCLLGTWGSPDRDATLTGCP